MRLEVHTIEKYRASPFQSCIMFTNKLVHPRHRTLAKLHVSVLTSFIKLIKLLQNLMKLLPNHIMV